MSDEEISSADDTQKGESPRELYLPELRMQIARHRQAWQRLKSGVQPTADLDLPAPTHNAPTQGSVNVALPGFGSAPAARLQGPEDDPLMTQTTQAVKRKMIRLRLEWAMRFAMPCAAAVLGLIALPLGIQPPRSQKTWGPGLSAVLGLVVFVLYYATLSIGTTLADRGALPPELCAWLPNIFALAVGALFIHRMGSERWHSIAHGIEAAAQLLVRLVRRRPEVEAT